MKYFILFFINIYFSILYIYGMEAIYVNRSPALSVSEKILLARKSQYTQAALSNFLGTPVKTDHPRVALCTSGGGYRTMIYNSGALLALEDIGLLPAITYSAALSGSTWLFAPLIVQQPISLRDFAQKLKARVNRPFWNIETLHTDQILAALENIYLTHKKITPADLWGAIIVDRLMGDVDSIGKWAQCVKLSDIARFLDSLTVPPPIPIFTTVCTDVYPYQWLETTPYTMGDYLIGGFIPTYSFDSLFNTGICTSLLQEKPLSSFLGVFGSPYCASGGDILLLISEFAARHTTHRWLWDIIYKATEYIIKQAELSHWRFLPSHFYNFTFNLPILPDFPVSPAWTKEHLTIVDAGFDFNNPFPPLLHPERATDIILVCDASSDVTESSGLYPSLESSTGVYPELEMARIYAHRHGLPFPLLDHPEVISEHLSIFHGQPGVPTIIYYTNPVGFSTLKLSYTPEEFDQLSGTIYKLITSTKENIANAIKRKIPATLSQSHSRWCTLL